MYVKKIDLVTCPYEEPCCMKEGGSCVALSHTDFLDECHFRKTEPDGRNLYDEKRRKNDDVRDRMEAYDRDPIGELLRERWNDWR